MSKRKVNMLVVNDGREEAVVDSNEELALQTTLVRPYMSVIYLGKLCLGVFNHDSLEEAKEFHTDVAMDVHANVPEEGQA